VAARLFDRYLHELLRDTPDVQSEEVQGFLLEPGESRVTLANGHARNRVYYFPDFRLDLDTTPIAIGPEPEPKETPNADAEAPEPEYQPHDMALDEADSAETVSAVVQRLREDTAGARAEVLEALINGHYFPLGHLDNTEPLVRAMRLIGGLSLLLASPPADTKPILAGLRESFPDEPRLRENLTPDELLREMQRLSLRSIDLMESSILRPGAPASRFPHTRYVQDGVVISSILRALEVVGRDSRSLRFGGLAIHARSCGQNLSALTGAGPTSGS
jgi:hypothetical protein